ncbi:MULTISPECIES: amidohydrolase [Aerococcus]|uniref:Amidohydrolase n=2 Tax=Aerococcus TaxID=1375 RepID=A0A178HIZ0_9LACT|nr:MULTISPECIES: amidohydrolase [Aerococcus]KAA9217523.1 amidohydrolase [Aerococcus loyolae]KAA9264072.1 amidohydrolase [Aerococcus loyolae]KAA9298011.1 amidohydrolase [Aerococcus tenax]MCY3025091.1 amidohydrolase [Aerococcus loyolae]MCY3028005.1 amidohydrolase [Aerococcus loyolae]
MSQLLDTLYEKLEEKNDRMIEIRRELHEHAEKSFEEEWTSDYIADFYKDLDCQVERNVGNGYGIVVTIDSGKEGKTVALRADFDALPIKEDTGLDFASKTDAMHACGHDGHTAYLLILAETFIELKDLWQGKIVILHQNAEEEGPGGAKSMVEAGCLDGVDNVFGMHVMSNMPVGGIYYKEGNAQTGRDNFFLTIKGEGGHASSPHTSNDAIVAGAYFVTQVQSIVSRRLNPFDVGSITIGNFDAAGAANAINGQVKISGDVRSMSPEVGETIEKEIKAKVKGLEASFGVTVELEYLKGYPVLYNDPEVTEFAVKALEDNKYPELKKVEATQPQPPSEDFAFYAKEVPSAFLWVGCASDDQDAHPAYPHHHPKFFMDEGALIVAAKGMATIVSSYIENDGIKA